MPSVAGTDTNLVELRGTRGIKKYAPDGGRWELPYF